MTDCPACREQGRGYVHTCEGSGVAVAEAAHEIGAVRAEPGQPIYDVALRAVIVGSRTDAEYVGAVLEQHCGRLGMVSEHSLTVADRPL